MASRTLAELRERAELYRHAAGPGGTDLHRFVVDRLPDVPGGRLLDLGGTAGATLAALAGARPGWSGVTADPSPALAAAAARRSPAVRAVADTLPFGAGCFAGVVAGHVVQDRRPDDIAEVAAELARVCEPGGRVLVVVDGSRHLGALCGLVDEATGGPLLSGRGRLGPEDVATALAPHVVVERTDVLEGEIVVRSAGPVLTYVRSLRTQLEPRLRGFTGMTMVLARVRTALEEALARDGRWATATETAVLVCRPA